MSKQEIIDLINLRIKANGNQEITGNILNGVLLGMLEQINDLTGDLSNLTTADRTNLVAAINEIKNSQQDVGIQVFSGPVNPNYLPPPVYDVADFFNQIDTSTNETIALWQYNGVRWFLVGGENSDTYLIQVGGISVVGNDVTYDYVKASINGVVYETASPTIINVPFAQLGKTRKDKIVIKNNGTLLRLIGVETSGIAVMPVTPIGTVEVDILDVSDNAINSNPIDPVDPIVVDNSDTIARTIDVTLAELGVATEAEVTLANIVTYFNGLGLSKPATEMYVVRIVEEAEPSFSFDIEGDFASVGITDAQSFFDETGYLLDNFSIVGNRITASYNGFFDDYYGLSYLAIDKVNKIKNNSLEILILSNNNLTYISGLGFLPNLKTLDVSDNQINIISGLENISSLTIFRASNNQIPEITGLENLVNLIELTLSNNQISIISGLSNLNSLTGLTLSNNQISIISGLSNLNNLVVLNLSNNQISSLLSMSNILDLPSLNNIQLKNNLLTSSSYAEALNILDSYTGIPKTIYLKGNADLTSPEFTAMKNAFQAKGVTVNTTSN